MSSRRFVTTPSNAFALVALLSDNPFYIQLKLRSLDAREESLVMKLWKWEPENLPSVIHSIRTAIAATVSLAVARLFGLPEAYWAAIVTLVVMQSTLGATLLISIERIATTAPGAVARALLASYFTGNLLVFAAAVFVLGLLCAAIRWEKPRIGMRALRLPLSCSFRVQTLHGSLRFTASSKSRLES